MSPEKMFVRNFKKTFRFRRMFLINMDFNNIIERYNYR